MQKVTTLERVKFITAVRKKSIIFEFSNFSLYVQDYLSKTGIKVMSNIKLVIAFVVFSTALLIDWCTS